MMERLLELQGDGDSIDLGDGRALRLRIEPDDANPFDEVDTYGKIGWPERDANGRPDRRPRGFTGNAEKVTINRDVAWWEPPTDIKRSDPQFPAFRRAVLDVAEFGWQVVSLELLEGNDAYGRAIVRDVASLGGIDSLADGYLTEVVGDLVSELVPMN